MCAAIMLRRGGAEVCFGLPSVALSLLVGEGAAVRTLLTEEDRLMRLPEVLRFTGMSRSALYDQMSRGEFPHSIKIGQRPASQLARAVHSWIAQRLEGEATSKKRCELSHKGQARFPNSPWLINKLSQRWGKSSCLPLESPEPVGTAWEEPTGQGRRVPNPILQTPAGGGLR